jgi:hypothetical protein
MVAMIFAAPNTEWLKIVASTCLGLVAGLVAEPIKSGMTSRGTRREVSRAIKEDLRFIRTLLPFFRLNKYDADHVSRLIELPAYEHFWSTNKPVFYQSAHLRCLRLDCTLILEDVDRMRSGRCTKLVGLTSIEETVTQALKRREMYFFERLKSKFRIWRFNRKHREYKDESMFMDNDGRCVPMKEVVIVDEDGKPIPVGEGR